jgi:hypothetical protein
MVQETLHRIAARPPLSQPDPLAVTITLGPSTTSSYFKDALEHLLEDAAWGLCSLRL